MGGCDDGRQFTIHVWIPLSILNEGAHHFSQPLPNDPYFISLSSPQAKCHQYWPEAGSVSFGELTVTIIDTQELAYYSIRTFRMNRVNHMTVM